MGVLVFALVGCQRDLGLEDRTFPCSAAEDCPSGQTCDLNAGRCVPEDQVGDDAGDTDASDNDDADTGADSDQLDTGDTGNADTCQTTNGGQESCDGLDNNCDGVIDEGCDDDGDGWCDADFTVTDQTTKCDGGSQTGDCDDTNPAINPGSAGCNGLDDDCDGVIDEVLGGTAGVSSFDSDLSRSTSVTDRVQAIATPTDTGICTLLVDESAKEADFVHLDPNASSPSAQVWTFDNAPKLLDIAFDGASCAALVDLGSAGLKLIQFNLTDGNIYEHTVTSSQADPQTETFYGGALTSLARGTGLWAIAYLARNNAKLELKLEQVASDFSSSSTTDVLEFMNATDLDRNPALGPSPIASDEVMLSFRAGTSTIGLRPFANNSFADEAVSLSSGDYAFGQTANILGGTYLTFRDRREVKFYEFASSTDYALSSTASAYEVPSSAPSTHSYPARNIFVFGDSPSTFMVESWQDRVLRISDDGAGGLAFDPVGLSDWLGSELLTIGESDGKLNVLRLSSDAPYSVQLDRLSCN
jgi:hypothetical protein